MSTFYKDIEDGTIYERDGDETIRCYKCPEHEEYKHDHEYEDMQDCIQQRPSLRNECDCCSSAFFERRCEKLTDEQAFLELI